MVRWYENVNMVLGWNGAMISLFSKSCEYGDCIIRKMWAAISPALNSDPERNLAVDSGQQRNNGGLCCHKCNSEYHILPNCLHCRNGGDNDNTPETVYNSNSTSNPNSISKWNSNNGGRVSEYRPPWTYYNSNSTSNSNSNSTGNLAPTSIWKYIHPSDQDQVIEGNVVTLKFTENVRCSCTGKLGFYNRSHMTSKHRGKKLSTLDPAPSALDKNEAPG